MLNPPPVLGLVDTIRVASLCNGAALVGRNGQATRSEIAQAIDMFSKANVIGVMANRINSPGTSNVFYTEPQNNFSVSLVPNIKSGAGFQYQITYRDEQ